jgi:hypothetical protein
MNENEIINAPDTAEESGVGEYKFVKPAKIDGEVKESVPYDFTMLNGSHIRHAKGELQRRGYTVAVKELDEVFHAAMFAEAAGISIAEVEAFSPRDYNAVADLARDFLYGEE